MDKIKEAIKELRWWFNVVILRKHPHSKCRLCWRKGDIHISAADERYSGWYHMGCLKKAAKKGAKQ